MTHGVGAGERIGLALYFPPTGSSKTRATTAACFQSRRNPYTRDESASPGHTTPARYQLNWSLLCMMSPQGVPVLSLNRLENVTHGILLCLEEIKHMGLFCDQTVTKICVRERPQAVASRVFC